MADNGKIIRNGAEIQIDENGNVVARPAAGQKLIVEDDARVGSLEAEVAVPNTEEITVNVPTDYDRIQDAVTGNLYRFVGPGTRVIINIESGYEIQTGPTYDDPADQEGSEPVSVWLNNAYAAHIWIRSEDNIVPVESGFDGSVIRFQRSFGPVLDCKIDVVGQGDGQSGYAAEMGSVGFVEPGAGVINAANRGLRARQSSLLNASFGVDFSGAGGRGCDINHGSTGYIRQGDFSNAGGPGLRLRGNANADAEFVDVSDASNDGVIAEECSFVNFVNGTANDCGRRGIEANKTSMINARDATIERPSIGILANDCSRINCRGISTDGGQIIADGRSDILAKNANLGTGDLTVTDGSIISAHGATYGSANITTNSLESEGIIFE